MPKKKSSPKATNQPNQDKLLIVGIGASAGGVDALTQFFEQVNADSGLAYVVILHLSPDYDSQLTQILQRVSAIPVTQVTEQVHVEANHVYVIPPNKQLQMIDGTIVALDHVRLEERRAPVDIFLRTLAESHGPDAIAVILSGTGANGSMGLKIIKENGGAVFVQNPREAAYSDMPRHAIATDLVDDILPVSQIPARLLAYRQGLGTVSIPEEALQRPEDQQQALREVFTQLRLRTGHDFSNYKRSTLLRRLERRIAIHRLNSLPAYAALLHEQPDETQALLKDLLISVTNFFRDEKVFSYVDTSIMPLLTRVESGNELLRIWVPGCATGEEAYSLAILCAERTLGGIDTPKVQIFATDIDEDAIAVAREGLYTLNDAADVSPERLSRFFDKEDDSYRIRREIREMILFAHHNVLKDPPFSQLNFISCRNLLIYLNTVAQERLMETFHFALKPGGYLLLGLSETVDGSSDLYATLNRESHMYQSRQVTSRPYPVPESIPQLPQLRKRLPEPTNELESRAAGRLSFGDLHQQLLEQYAPPSIIVNEEYDILHFTPRAGRYLHFSGGELSKNLLKLIRPELRLELRTTLYQATQQQTNVSVQNLRIQAEDFTETINLHVRPVVGEGNPAHGFILILFESISNTVDESAPVLTSIEPLARQLEEELIRAKTQLRASNEQHELQSEELKASNEELQAMNEELRSAAEELETGKEEMQSINEELTTVNQELKVKVEEASLVTNNLQNLINSTDIATLFLNRSLQVNLFTPSARQIFNLIPTDLGRPLTDITNRLTYPYLKADAEAVLKTLQPLQREVQTVDGRIFIARVAPYRTAEDRINGVVLTFVDITERLEAEQGRKASEEQFRLLVTATSNTIFKMSADWKQMLQMQGMNFLADTTMPNSNWMEAYIPPEEWHQVSAVIKQVITTKGLFELEHRVILANGDIGWTFSRAISILNEEGEIIEWFGAANDITQRKAAEDALRYSEARQVFLVQLSDALRPLIDTTDIQYVAAQMVGKYLGANQVHYGETVGDHIIIRQGYGSGLPPMVGRFRALDFGKKLIENFKKGFTVVSRDVERDPAITIAERQVFIQSGFRAYIAVPLIKEGSWVATLSVQCILPRNWQTSDIELVQAVAERTWASIERARAEEALRLSEQRLAAIRPMTLLDQTEELAKIGSWEYARPTNQFSWSDGMYLLFDMEMGEFVQPSIFHSFATESAQATAQHLVSYLQTGEGSLQINLQITVRNTVKTLRIKADVLAEEDNKRVMGVALDITDQLQAQQQIQQTAESLQAILNTSPASIGLLKAVRNPVNSDQITDFQLVVGNDKLADFFGQPLNELLGQPAERFTGMLWAGETLNVLRQVFYTHEFRYEERELPPGRWLAISATRHDDGVVLTGLDITELKHVQAQQQTWISELSESRHSIEALATLRASLSERTELLRSFSHDLRANFGIIQGGLQIMGMANSESERAQMMDMVLRNVKQATGLLTDLLDLARLETGQQQRTIAPFDAAQLLRELGESFQPMADTQALELILSGPESLLTENDRQLVYRMAQNLIINALKYTHTGSVTVHWEQTDDAWWFEVADTGPGLSADLVERLNVNRSAKNKSEQTDSITSSFPLQPSDDSTAFEPEQPNETQTASRQADWVRLRGEGIGLRIVHELAQLLEARLDVRSKINVGTQFRVYLPLRYSS